MEAMKNPVPFQPENLGPAVNSEYSEYWPALSVDEKMLMFTVMLPGELQIRRRIRLSLQEDFFYSTHKAEGSWEAREEMRELL